VVSGGLAGKCRGRSDLATRCVCSKIKNKFYHKKQTLQTITATSSALCLPENQKQTVNELIMKTNQQSTHTPQIGSVYRLDRSDYIMLELDLSIPTTSSLAPKELCIRLFVCFSACLFNFFSAGLNLGSRIS